METFEVTLSSRGTIVLPAGLCQQMGLKPGTKMTIRRDQDRLILRAISSFSERLSGFTQKTIAQTVEAVDEYIDDQRADIVSRK